MAAREVITSCTCDCPDTCSILATVSEERVTAIRGNPEFRITRGFLCRRSHGFLRRIFSRERVLYPMRREGSTWRRITWDDACDAIAAKTDAALREYGPLSLYYFRYGGSLAALKLVNERFFNLLGGGTFSSGSLCGGAGTAGQTADFGQRTSHDPFDLLNARMIIIWGRNPAWTNVHLMPILIEAKRKGTLLVLIDPVRTATARIVDTHIRLKPGTDNMLALGIAKLVLAGGMVDQDVVRDFSVNHDAFVKLTEKYTLEVISDITGVTTKEIRDLAWLYARVFPAAIIGGWGLQRRHSGGNTYRMLDALGAITRNIGIRGGGVSHGMDETRWFDKRVTLAEGQAERREIPRPQTGRGVLAADRPPIRVLFVSGSNPVNQCPNTELVRRALASIDFKVVIDMFMTDTAQVADIVLPATHFLQERDVVGSFWHNYVMPVNVSQARLGEEKTDLEAFAALGKRLGLRSLFVDDPDYYLGELVRPLKAQGISLADIMAGPVRPPSAVDVPFRGRRFATPSSKFEFVTEVIAPWVGRAEGYPYHLLSPHPRDATHSQLPGEFRRETPRVLISPVAAAQSRIADGDEVVVESPVGSLRCVAVLSEDVRHDTVLIHEGAWDCLGGSVNRLTPDDLSDRGQSATYYDAMCKLSRAAETH